MGLMTGWIFQGTRMLLNHTFASFVAGFSAAFLNTALFMGSLVLLFGSTEYLQNLMGGRNVLLFIVTFVGINAVFEMLVSTAVSGLLGKTLEKAHLIRR
jgi:F0F1-type ATP synthase assembly protein I